MGATVDETADETDVRDALIEELKDRIRYLEEESRRKDHLLAAALERIPAIEPASEPRDGPETVAEAAGGGEVPPDGERRSWWRRFFGY